MKLGHLLGWASGPSGRACHFLALRFDERWGFKPEVGETWIFQRDGDETHLLHGGLGWYTGLWRSPAGQVYVSAVDGRVLVNPDPHPGAAPWRIDRLAGVLTGVWGLDDRFVLAWGVKGNGTVMFRHDGSKWEEIESPGEVISVHGLTPDLVVAVGRNGLIARWDGTRWNRVVSPSRGVLSAVHLASEDEMYAVGANRRLLQGSVHGWIEVLEGPGPMFGVAKWNGQVWVGAADHGLKKLAGSKLEPAKPDLKAEHLEAGGELLVSSPELVASTSDGTSFTGTPVSLVAKMLSDRKPAWLK